MTVNVSNRRVEKKPQPSARMQPNRYRFPFPVINTSPRKLRQQRQSNAKRNSSKARMSSASRGTKLLGGASPQTLSRNFSVVVPTTRPQDKPKWRKLFDGSVSEAEHLDFHSGCKGFCIRCDFHKRRPVYEACSPNSCGGSWLSAGVHRGIWGLGCSACAKHLGSGRKIDNARLSKFAKFQFRPTSGFAARWQLEQHSKSLSHRVACGQKRKRDEKKVVANHPQPLARPINCSDDLSSTVLQEDAILFKGNVPSAAEWSDGWSVLSENLSLRKGGRMFEKKHGLRAANKKRKLYRKQLVVMAELLRNDIRKTLSQATFISLSLDECKYRKILRFRADKSCRSNSLCSLWRNVCASGFSQSGVLGSLDCSKKHASDFEDDHAVTAVKQLDDFLTKFCTPRGRRPGQRRIQFLDCDLELKAHILKSVTCVSADGASKERRAVFMAAREIFPNALIVIRDPAHAIRIASKALHCDELFGEVWEALFNSRHALVPDLMNSHKWHNLLVAIQEDCIQAVSRAGVPQPLAEIIRNVSFAKQRFDSTAGPVGKIALMLLPVATMLAYIASDKRNERDQRERATALLKRLDSKFCTAVAASADWGIICNWFLRLFDVANHDIAKSRAEIDCMIETLDAVFVEKFLFKRMVAPQTSPTATALASSAAEEPLPRINLSGTTEENMGFISAKVMRNLRRRYVFYAGGLPVLLWGDLTASDQEDLLCRLRNVARLTKERLIADFPRDDVRSALSIFDRRLVQKAFGPIPCNETRKFLLRGVRKLAALLGCEETAAVLQYNGVLPYMLSQTAAGQPLAEKTNPQAWALLLDDGFWEKACPKRFVAASGVLRRLIRFYISIEDGECTVERDLGEFRAAQIEFRTSDADFLDDCLVMKLNGPKTLEQFQGGLINSTAELTPFSRKCASLWLELFGNRRGHFNPSATAAAKMKRFVKKSFFKRAQLGVLAAARAAVESARLKRGARRSSGAHYSGADASDISLLNDSMTKFKRRSAQNIPGCVQLRSRPGAEFAKPVGVDLSARCGSKPQPLACEFQYNPKIAFVGERI